MALALAIAALSLAATLSACGPFGGDALRVALRDGSAPLAYKDSDGSARGFEADYARLLAGKMGKQAKLTFMDPADMADALEDGDVDLALSARASVHDLVGGFAETAPFIAYGTCVAVPQGDDTLTRESELRGRRVGALRNSDADMLCESLLAGIAFDYRKYDNEAQPFQDMRLDNIDVVFSDELYARYLAIAQPDSIRIMDHVYDRRQYGARVSREAPQSFANDISAAVAELDGSEDLIALYQTWFGKDMSPE